MIHVSTAARNAGLDARFDRVDLGTGPGRIYVYEGGRPSTADDETLGVELAVFTLETPAFAPAANGEKTLTIGAGFDTTAVADGTPAWARVTDGDGLPIFDGTVGTSGADFLINMETLQTGQPVHLLLGTITDPASP